MGVLRDPSRSNRRRGYGSGRSQACQQSRCWGQGFARSSQVEQPALRRLSSHRACCPWRHLRRQQSIPHLPPVPEYQSVGRYASYRPEVAASCSAVESVIVLTVGARPAAAWGSPRIRRESPEAVADPAILAVHSGEPAFRNGCWKKRLTIYVDTCTVRGHGVNRPRDTIVQIHADT